MINWSVCTELCFEDLLERMGRKFRIRFFNEEIVIPGNSNSNTIEKESQL